MIDMQFCKCISIMYLYFCVFMILWFCVCVSCDVEEELV